jgi:hypothetical protein
MQYQLGSSDARYDVVNLIHTIPTPGIDSKYLIPWIPVWVKDIPANDIL